MTMKINIVSQTQLDELLKRILPQEASKKKDILTCFASIGMTQALLSAIVIAAAERENFDNNPSSCFDWVEECTKWNNNYIRHLARIGRVMLDAEDNIFDIMKQLNYKKMLDILTLRDDIEKFILSRGKALIKWSDKKVREEVYLIRGKQPEDKSPNPESNSKWQPSLWDGIEVVFNFDEDDFYNLELDALKANKMMYSGIGMLSSSIKYWEHSDSDVSYLAMVEAELRRQADTVKEIREKQADKLMQAS